MASDDAVAAMARSILAEKRARKVAEDDALRLYNRVRQLQKEEDRAQKRIIETKKKAKEIIKARERNEQKLLEKEQRQRELQEQVEEQKLDNLRAKEEALRHRIEQENKIYQDKLDVVQKTKEERAEIERLLAESRLLARKEALEQKDFIRKQQEDARRKIETLKLQKLTAAQEEYERRLKEEIDAKIAKEQEIERLAQMELELIERLKSKQAEQRKAYQQLEAVLSLGTVSTSKGLANGKPASPKVTAVATGGGGASPERPSSNMSHTSAASMPYQPADEAVPDGEPTEEDVARAFAIYDTDGIGEISTLSLDGLLRDLGVPLNPSQLSQAIAQLDTSQTGRITFGEFLLWWKG
ncbi:hypothetical protein PLESTB_000916300 [Pleodorina starrii]|uniref:EF-hand domain-containing protein n=1 Tax=Pleodorina starrii TaxID=330485 RepID=A0A9W6F3X0_9CHLO|nr:hypothetical protein PLESTM_001527300 [Pleodorina starrii]GLC54885.1 hypothetical protein PLESTB_000916300 [Pleodorina starrii]GLC73666.1 hypothetical protein PLESTF_001406200 [Pleodorina starrii]